MKLLLLVLLLLVAIPAFTQQDSVKITTPGDTVVVTETWTVRQLKQFARQQRRDSIRAHKKVWLSILGGPSYNPEASLGVGGAMLMTFRMNPDDTISQRSFIPVGFNISINGTFVAAGAGTLFFNENKFRIYIKYGYRTEPANFYGIGYDEIKKAEELKDRYDKDSVTFHKASIQFFPRFVWEVKPNIYVGTLLDFNYNYTKSLADWMKTNPAILKYGNRYHNIGVGALFQYDTRDDVATPFEGVFLSAMGTLYGKYLGGNYNYEMLELEYRQFRQVFKRRQPKPRSVWIMFLTVSCRISVIHSICAVTPGGNTGINRWLTALSNTGTCLCRRKLMPGAPFGRSSEGLPGSVRVRSEKPRPTGINGNSTMVSDFVFSYNPAKISVWISAKNPDRNGVFI